MEMSEAIRKSIKYIEGNIETKLTLKSIASFAGYSEYHFSRLFREQMGISVMEYVNKRKMRKAAEEILNGEKIIDIAVKYGYDSHSGFIKAFKNEFGFSPSLLRTMKIEIGYWGGNTMRNVILEKTEEHAKKEELYKILCQKAGQSQTAISEEKLKSAYDFACGVYNGINRYSGDEYVTHTINVAIVLAQLEAGEDVVIAGLLCDAFIKTHVTKDEVADNTSEKVCHILERASNYTISELMDAKDEECIMLKLAERLHNMCTIKYMDDSKKHIKAKETVEIYMPIAQKIGNESITKELKELAVKYI